MLPFLSTRLLLPAMLLSTLALAPAAAGPFETIVFEVTGDIAFHRGDGTSCAVHGVKTTIATLHTPYARLGQLSIEKGGNRADAALVEYGFLGGVGHGAWSDPCLAMTPESLWDVYAPIFCRVGGYAEAQVFFFDLSDPTRSRMFTFEGTGRCYSA